MNAIELQEEDYEDQQTWYDAQTTNSAGEEACEEGEEEEGQKEHEDLNAIVASSRESIDRSKQACHGHFFNPGGCMYMDKGKQCPYSHDPVIGQQVIEAAMAKLKKFSK